MIAGTKFIDIKELLSFLSSSHSFIFGWRRLVAFYGRLPVGWFGLMIGCEIMGFDKKFASMVDLLSLFTLLVCLSPASLDSFPKTLFGVVRIS
jgi:hypothetical protein